MIAVIIAGGSGTRLWPLSTQEQPKHLLSLTNEYSLLQNTFKRAARVAKHIYVVTEHSHAELLRGQLPELPVENVIVEPGRRGTASCIILALHFIKQRHGAKETIIFMHADHVIRDEDAFIATVSKAAEESVAHQRQVLLGVEPTYPSTGFGYIERGDEVGGSGALYGVGSFKEKPDHATAQSYVKAGKYLWNMGYFVAPLSVFESNIKKHAPRLRKDYQKLMACNDSEATQAAYLDFESEPIDTALNEKTPDLLVIPGTFDWVDVGSFGDLHGISEQDEAGNVVKGRQALEAVTNSYIHNETNIPVAVIGLDNIVVVATEAGVLVVNKNFSQKVGDVSKRFAA